jgi:hypothetical protein
MTGLTTYIPYVSNEGESGLGVLVKFLLAECSQSPDPGSI